MTKALNRIPVAWIIALPLIITIIVFFIILPLFVESNMVRSTQMETDRVLTGVAFNLETTLRDLMTSNPGKINGFHNIISGLQSNHQKQQKRITQQRKRTEKMQHALKLIGQDPNFQVVSREQIQELKNRFDRQMQDLRYHPVTPGFDSRIVPAPVVREEKLKAGQKQYPERYPRPDGIETLVITSGQRFSGTTGEGTRIFRRLTVPVTADSECMECHLAAIEGQPLAAITVETDMNGPMAVIQKTVKRVYLFGLLIVLFLLLIATLSALYVGTRFKRLVRQAKSLDDNTMEPEPISGGQEINALSQALENIHSSVSPIMNNLPVYWFNIDREGQATADCSPKIKKLFGNIEGKDVDDLFFKPEDQEAVSLLERAFKTGETMSFEELTAAAPESICIDGRTLTLEYHPIYQQKRLENILVVGTDQTAITELEDKWLADRKNHEMTIAFLKNPAGVKSLLSKSIKRLKAGLTLLKQDDGLLTNSDIAKLSQTVNTILNDASIFNIEGLISQLQDSNDQLNDPDLVRRTNGRTEAVAILISLINNVQEITTTNRELISEVHETNLLTVTPEEAQQLVDTHPDLDPLIHTWKQTLQLEFVRSTAETVVKSTAIQLGKEVKLTVKGDEGRISEQTAESIKLALTLLLRNAVGHGIEDPGIRETIGKWPGGNIHILLKNKGKNLQINIRDDGKGIQTDELVRNAIKKGLLESGTRLEPQKALNLIFKPGFSTITNGNNNFGQGTGLSLVKKTINKSRGLITVRSEAGVGTEFIIILNRNP